MKKINWGIIGCGHIAHVFAKGLQNLDQGTLFAAASHSFERVSAFGEEYGIKRRYSDYHELACDPDIDAIYIATTHNFHFENTKLCLEHGKHVLCEKPLTVNAQQTKGLIALAEEKNLFLMEAVWMRFLPAISKLREYLNQGIIGKIKTIKADFNIKGDFSTKHRLRNKMLAGGALLDLGIYPINFTSMIFAGQPEQIKSTVVFDETGVDESSYYLFNYGNGQTAMLSSSYSQHAPIEAVICGSKGYIRIPDFIGAQQLHIHLHDKTLQILDFPFEEDQKFSFEITHAMECISKGKNESSIMPNSETLAIMKTMDQLRAQWDLEYPCEAYPFE